MLFVTENGTVLLEDIWKEFKRLEPESYDG
jgi:hypothetical protein